MIEVQATTVYLSTRSVTGIGGIDYRNLTTSTGSADASTSIRVARSTGRYIFDPLTADNSPMSRNPDSGTPVGYGWATSYTLSGVIPAGNWVFQTNTTASSASGQTWMGYVVYKNCSGTNTVLFSVFNSTANVTHTATSTKIITTTSQSSFIVDGCYLKVEYWLNVTRAGSSPQGRVTFGINDANAYITYPTTVPPYINISLNSPQNNTWNTSQSITHTYISYILNGGFLNCTLWTNRTGTWTSLVGNSTPITNNSANTITYNYGADYNDIQWNVYCYASGGVYNYSTNNFTLKIDTTPPSQVAGLTNASTGSTWVNLTWNVATDTGSGVQKYLIWRNGTNIANTTNTWYNNTGLDEFSLYNYTVGAVDNYNNFGANSTALIVNTTGVVTTISTNQSSYRSCGAVYYKVSIYDSEKRLRDENLTIDILDPAGNAASQSKVRTAGGVYQGVYILVPGSQIGEWLIRSLSCCIFSKSFGVGLGNAVELWKMEMMQPNIVRFTPAETIPILLRFYSQAGEGVTVSLSVRIDSTTVGCSYIGSGMYDCSTNAPSSPGVHSINVYAVYSPTARVVNETRYFYVGG